jgi:hypothetical protein
VTIAQTLKALGYRNAILGNCLLRSGFVPGMCEYVDSSCGPTGSSMASISLAS